MTLSSVQASAVSVLGRFLHTGFACSGMWQHGCLTGLELVGVTARYVCFHRHPLPGFAQSCLFIAVLVVIIVNCGLKLGSRSYSAWGHCRNYDLFGHSITIEGCTPIGD